MLSFLPPNELDMYSSLSLRFFLGMLMAVEAELKSFDVQTFNEPEIYSYTSASLHLVKQNDTTPRRRSVDRYLSSPRCTSLWELVSSSRR